MIQNRFNMFLRAPEVETPAGGEAAPEQQAAPDTGAKSEQEKANAPPAKPGLLDQVKASLQDKGGLLARAESAEAKVKTLEGEIAQVRADLATVTGERDTARGELAEIGRAFEEAKAGAKTVERQAAAVVAKNLGVETQDLPERQQEGSTLEALRAKLEKATDEQEIFRISQQIDAEEAKAARID